MTDFDIKLLLERLDGTCLDFLHKASQFCVQHHCREVSVEHYLLQMMGERSHFLNRLLEQHAIDAVPLIKILLNRVTGSPANGNRKPVFSSNLQHWFALAAEDASEQGASHVSQQHLLSALLEGRQLYRSMGLTALDRLSTAQVTAFAEGQATTAQPPPDSPTETAEYSEGTVVISTDEIPTPPVGIQDDIHITGYGELRKIGEGGMASVYHAKHLGLQRDVALKVLHPGAGEDFANRFLREARIVARLAHPNIIQVYDIDQTANQTYLAMEYITGGELSDRMQKGFSLQQTIAILRQVLSALQCAHDEGFIHRDIKPANILFRDAERVVLTDFGIARAMEEDTGLTIAGSILGTPRYMSPEQARGETLDHRSDLYSMGVLCYQMLEGRLPYIGDSAMGTAMKHIMDPVPVLSEGWRSMQPFIDTAMAKQVDDRFQSAQQMIDALLDTLD